MSINENFTTLSNSVEDRGLSKKAHGVCQKRNIHRFKTALYWFVVFANNNKKNITIHRTMLECLKFSDVRVTTYIYKLYSEKLPEYLNMLIKCIMNIVLDIMIG